MPTPLDNYPQVRLWIYTAFWIVSLLIGSAQAYWAALGHAAPPWFTGAMAVYTFLGLGFGYTAAANTPKTGDSQ